MSDAKGLLSPTAAQMVEKVRRQRVEALLAEAARWDRLTAKRKERGNRRYVRWLRSGGCG